MRRLLLITLSLLTAIMVSAQVTTSGISGKVKETSTQEAVIGATVVLVHEPSGTKYATVTNPDGRFEIQGMRNGGPYSATISYIGFETKHISEIYLDLAETYNLSVLISENSNELKDVVVTGKASKFTTEKTGASTNIRSSVIEELPRADFSLEDIAKLSPYYGAINNFNGGNSFAGGNGKSANFTLDGANLNNNFGLSAQLPGGGNPVSLEALDEVQLVVAPFDVRQTNFIGGGINAVTKSGTNTFKGSAYFYYTDENMHGNRVDGLQNANPDPAQSKTYGFTFGGPILKDKLFFFTSFERIETESVPSFWKPSVDGVADSKGYVSRTSVDDLRTISDFVLNKYGYNTGSYTDFPSDITVNKYLARVDWNISRMHRLAVRFNHTNSEQWKIPSTSRSGFYGTTYSVSQNSIAYHNSYYSTQNKVTTLSADLNSRFSDKASNQFILTYSYINDPRGTHSSPFPFVDIMKDGAPYIALGMEQYTFGNEVKNKVFTINDNFTYYLGRHKLMAGLNFEHQLADNSYMIFGRGYYRYNSMDDFLNGAAPAGVALTYGFDGEETPTASVRFNMIGLYFQDEWMLRDNLKLTGGIRFDNISYNDSDLRFNQTLYDLSFGGRHLDVGRWPKANIQVSPRIGVSWDVFGDRTLKVRGGTGLFAGRLPLVFFVNMPQYSGMWQNQIYSTKASVMNNFQGGLVADPDGIREKFGAPYSLDPNGVVPSQPAGVDRDFKMPQVWKTAVAVDYQMPVSFPLTVTGEFTFTKNINAVRLDNWNVKDPSEWTYTDGTVGAKRFSGADNRLQYPSNKDGYLYYKDISSACVLTNTSKGYGWTANLTINAEPVKDLNIMAAYTHTVMKEVTSMPGSNAGSAWAYMHTIDGPNFSGVQTSSFVVPDRIIANISYKYKNEHLSLFYQGYSPQGWSYVYDGDLNGDGQKCDLIYIPRDDSEIKFISEDDRKAFWAFVDQDSYLSSHKGEYAEATSARAPWVHRFDFRYAHDFKFKLGTTQHKIQLSLDIKNVGNLLNSRWGVEKIPARNNQSNSLYRILNVEKIENNQPVYSFAKQNGQYLKESWDYNHAFDQCWKLQLGIKYFFN